MHLKILLPALALLAALAVGGCASGQSGSTADREHAGHDHAAGDPAHTKPSFTRHLAVYTGTREPAPSAHPEHMQALLVDGAVPKRAVIATVLSDEDCAADRRGVSHCRNRLRLPNGRTLTVRHPHRMADVPCMTPGERVRVDRGTAT